MLSWWCGHKDFVERTRISSNKSKDDTVSKPMTVTKMGSHADNAKNTHMC